MKQLRIKDNSPNGKELFAPVSHVASRVADKTLAELEKEGIFVFPQHVAKTAGLEEDQIVLQSVNDTFRTGNVMGFLGYRDERITIGSRFGDDEQDWFLQYLLERVLDFPALTELETDVGQDNRLMNLLVFLFPRYLKSAMRKGLFKAYIRREYNDSHPKGTIDVARHIRKNTPFVGNIAYSRREYSHDNALMQLIRHTIEHIKRKPFGRRMLAAVKDEVRLVVGATPTYRADDLQKLLSENNKNTVRHAYYREYRMLQYLCVLILQDRKQEIGRGAKRAYGILFDGAWLWEEYVHLLICDKFYHPMNKAGDGVQQLFSTASGKLGRIYPDFISKRTENRIIADAKYKPVGNIGNRDYCQVLAYMLRFDAKTGWYLYPEIGGAQDVRLHLNKGSTYEHNVEPREDIVIVKHGLKIPSDARSYSDFSQRMKQAERDFTEYIFA